MKGKVAIVGAGPSGCYVAQALLKVAPDLEVDIIDSLPVPFGLIRYGVACDHQGTKAVSRQFARIFERQGARFFGNARVGRDVTLQALREAYDAVVVAAGLHEDRKLGIPGDDLPGIQGSGMLTRALYQHPDAAPLPDLGPRPLIVGNGNVAIDLLRLLCKAPDELHGSDLGAGPTAWLARNRFESITIIGRSPASRAKFDPVMIRELGKLGGIRIDVLGADRSEEVEERKRLDALAAIDGHGSGPLRVTFRFDLVPIAVTGGAKVDGLRVEGPHGDEKINASSIVTAIGFGPGDRPDLDRLAARAADRRGGKLADGLFAAGWFRRGPRGTIPDSRLEGQETADLLLKEMVSDPARPGSAILADLVDVVDYSGWQRIDETELAGRTSDRCRRKLTSTAEFLRVAKQQEKHL